jgi:hypothetical protein
VYFIGQKPPYDPLKLGMEWLDLRYLDPTNVPLPIKSVLRLPTTKMLIGGLVFPRILTPAELRYAAHYVRLGFAHNLVPPISEPLLLFMLLSRSSQNLKGIDRVSPYVGDSPAVIQVSGHDSLEWTVVLDPFSEGFRMTIAMMVHVAEMGIARITLIPAVGLSMTYIPSHLHSIYVPVITTDGIDSEEDDSVVITPPSWVKHRDNHPVIVTAVCQIGFAKGATQVQVGGQTRRPLDDGYFVMMLPIGIHRTAGLVQGNVTISSLVPYHQFFSPSSIKFVVNVDTRIHIFSFVSEPSSEWSTRMMLYTAKANSRASLKVWLLNGFQRGIPTSIDTEIIPPFWPSFVPRPSSPSQFCKIAKFLFLDLLIPLEVRRILILDDSVVLRKDVAVFRRVDLDTAVCAAPLISSSRRKALYWNLEDIVQERFGRPFHTSALVWVDLARWVDARAGYIFRKLYLDALLMPKDYPSDDDLFNQLQLHVQIATLPEGTTFCSLYNRRDLATSAFAHMMCSPDSPRLFGPKYDEIRAAAAAEFP